MPHLRLSEADRTRLGAPEDLPLDLTNVTNREAIELATIGYATPARFRQALFGDPFDMLAWTGAVWLCLKRAGITADLATLEFDFDHLDYIPDEKPPEPKASGKAPRSRSRTSTRTRSTGSGT